MSTTIEQRRAPWPVAFYRSAVGKKWAMAITGILIIGFVILHMVGNWKIFLPDVDGVPDIDIYAHALRQLLVPFLLTGTPLVALIPERLAVLTREAAELQVLEAPVPLPAISDACTWHPRRSEDPAHQWLVARLAALAASPPDS